MAEDVTQLFIKNWYMFVVCQIKDFHIPAPPLRGVSNGLSLAKALEGVRGLDVFPDVAS